MGYRNVYFRINSKYIHDKGWPSESQKQDFQNETAALFQGAGWTFHQSTSSGASNTVTKGLQQLYLHPMNFNGEILEDEIPKVETLLQEGKSFQHYHTDIYEEYVELNDDEYQALLVSKHNEIMAALLEACTTKRRNLYLTGDIVNRVAKKFSVRRLSDRDKYGSKANFFVGELFEKLVSDGWILTAQTRNGMGFRAVSAKDRKRRLAG